MDFSTTTAVRIIYEQNGSSTRHLFFVMCSRQTAKTLKRLLIIRKNDFRYQKIPMSNSYAQATGEWIHLSYGSTLRLATMFRQAAVTLRSDLTLSSKLATSR